MNSIAHRDHIFSHSHAYNGIEFKFDGTDGLCVSIGGGSWTLSDSVLHSTGLSTGQWHHVALVRNGSSIDGYLDGTKGTTRTFSGTIGTPTNSPYLGSNRGGGFWFDGYIDDFRITIGLARYTSSFTPPTTAYLTSAGDVNKQIIVNSAADGVAIGTGGINQARIAKAWVDLDGTGTIDINDSYNVSSITDNGTGDYTVTFSTAMTNVNYAVSCSVLNNTWSHSGDNSYRNAMPQKDGYLTSSIRVFSKFVNATNSGQEDENKVNVIVFGN
jgi:hypothetical protein